MMRADERDDYLVASKAAHWVECLGDQTAATTAATTAGEMAAMKVDTTAISWAATMEIRSVD